MASNQTRSRTEMERTGEFYLIIIIKNIAEIGLIFFPSQTGAGLEDYSFLSLTTTNITHGLQTAGLCHWLATWLSQFIGCCFMKAGSDKKLPGWFTGSSRGGRFIINTLDFTSSQHQSQSDLLSPAQPFPSWLTTFQLYLDLRHGHHHHHYHCPVPSQD